MIIQGSNSPIVLEFEEDMSSIKDISIFLYTDNDNLRLRWGIRNVEIFGNLVKCPLTQKQTMELNPGNYKLEIKYLDESGFVQQAQILDIVIDYRKDRKGLVMFNG